VFASPAPSGPVAQPAATAAPGEYTRMFGTPAPYAATETAPPPPPPPGLASLPPPAAAVAPAPPRPARSSFLPVVIVVAVIVLAGLAVLAYFLMRHH